MTWQLDDCALLVSKQIRGRICGRRPPVRDYPEVLSLLDESGRVHVDVPSSDFARIEEDACPVPSLRPRARPRASS